MEKGIEIKFKIENNRDSETMVKALAFLTSKSFNESITFAIFRVKKAEDKFYKILFSGPKLNKLHPHFENMVKEKFEELTNEDIITLLSDYKRLIKEDKVKEITIKELSEEYDLWSDPIWQYL